MRFHTVLTPIGGLGNEIELAEELATREKLFKELIVIKGEKVLESWMGTLKEKSLFHVLILQLKESVTLGIYFYMKLTPLVLP